jgi:lipid-binding SYLF domain-containing protein
MEKRVVSGISAFGLAGILVMALLITAVMPVSDSRAGDAQDIVDRARVTLNGFMRNEDYTWLHAHLKDAKGLLIYPQVIKAGFIFGGSGGTGVLVVRGEKTDDWSQPVFYTIGSATFGLQIGGEVAEVIVMAMSQKAIDSLLTSSFKLGGDTSVALGPVGAGAKGNVTADFISFAKSKGLYAGINVEGAVVNVRDSLNREYYGKEVSPADIIFKNEASNEGSEELRASLRKMAE